MSDNELTWQDRQRFTDNEVKAEMLRMGIPAEFPSAEEFDAETVLMEVDNLSDMYRYEDIATLRSGEYPPTVLIKFSELARALGQTVTTQYGEMKIRRPTTSKQRRESAVSNLRSRLYQQRKDMAIRSLMQTADN